MNILISVSNKKGLVEFAKTLHQDHGAVIYSTGGSAAKLKENGIPVQSVSDYTGFPELLDGRVKTLHPKIFGGILACRDKRDHVDQAASNGIVLFDIVVVNLYPFQETAARPDASMEDIIENIDIGGVALIRAAAKNYQDVAVITNPSKYELMLQELTNGKGSLSSAFKLRLACEAFEHTARYDEAISAYFKTRVTSTQASFPQKMSLTLKKVCDLRYGENPHQKASFYTDSADSNAITAAIGTQLHGKELSFNNILDSGAAAALIDDMPGTAACAILKHTNPCGAAAGSTPVEAYTKALATDPVSAFGSIVAFNVPVDAAAAEQLSRNFVEVVIAPGYDETALEILKQKKNIRIMKRHVQQGRSAGGSIGLLRSAAGGYLIQDPDSLLEKEADLKCVTTKTADAKTIASLLFSWAIVKHVKSNAIVLVDGTETVGIGAGQMSRVDSVKIALQKANKPVKGCVLASDAFFPFRDSIDEIAARGIKAVIQPGGSVRDEEVITACNEHGIAMYFTGSRHFRH